MEIVKFFEGSFQQTNKFGAIGNSACLGAVSSLDLLPVRLLLVEISVGISYFFPEEIKVLFVLMRRQGDILPRPERRTYGNSKKERHREKNQGFKSKLLVHHRFILGGQCVGTPLLSLPSCLPDSQ